MTATEILIEDREFWNQFIDLYRNLPVLWSKPANTEQKKVSKNLRDRGYAILLRKFSEIDPSVTVDSIKAVLKQLRSTYRAELSKKLQYTRNATTGSTIPCSPSPWYVDALSFLKSPNSERPDDSNAYSVTTHSDQVADDIPEDLGLYFQALAVEFQKLSDTQLRYAQAHVERILRGAQIGALSSDWPKTDPSLEEVSYRTPEAWFNSAATSTGRGGKRGASREENGVPKCSKLNEEHTQYIENVAESEDRQGPSTNDDASFEVKYEICEDVLMDDGSSDSETQMFHQDEHQQQTMIKYEYTDYDERDVVSENDEEQVSMNDSDEQHENASVTFPLELNAHDTLHERHSSDTTENVEISTVGTNETTKANGQMQSTARKASHEATMSDSKHFMIVRLPSGTALRRQCTAHKSAYIDNVVVNYSETEFLENFRVGRKTVHKLCQHLAKIGCFQQAKGHGGYAAIGVETNVLAFLWFLGQEKAHYRDVAERFDLSLSCLHDVIWRVCDALLLLKPTVFVRPNESRKQMLVDHFAKLCTIPGVIGVVDGTHIRIDKPSENANTYLVQKRYYSLQLQAIFDENKQFVDVFVDYPGEPDLLTAVRELCTDQYCILGSDSYPCLPQLLVPYRSVAEPLTEGQVMFNAQLAAVQKMYANTFTMVKQRFRQLYHLKSRQLSNVVKLIKVCCMLHNLAPPEEMPLLGRDNTQQKMPFSEAGYVFTYASKSEPILELGKQKREQICAYLQTDASR